MPQLEKILSKGEEKTLLRLARHVLEKFVGDGVNRFPDKDLGEFDLTESIKRPSGVFVTLNEGERLRGCIGSIQAREPLYRGVIENAMNSAARDLRFGKVRKEELPDIEIEISVMSPLVKVQSLEDIVVGRDGLVLRAGWNSGVFLPQVPVEWKWEKKEYLEQLGQKAGLDSEAYQRKDAELWKFTAQVFSEK